MRPFAAVQPLMRRNKKGDWIFAGSCFRLWSPNHYITANHCIQGAEPDHLKVLNVISGAQDLECSNVARHPAADIAIIQIEGDIPGEYERFKLADKWGLGGQIHCFGYVSDTMATLCAANARVIGGIIQREFVYDDGIYKSPAIELSAPIPKGTSGGPAFIAASPEYAIGVAIATIKSEVVVHGFEEYKENGHYEKERISEITRYGVILQFHVEIIRWLEEKLGTKKQ
jgi:S1-C subfamily serine protease